MPHLETQFKLYADGGVIGQNPSAVGGTWAWRQVSEVPGMGDVVGASSAGVITPKEAGMLAISNNLTEMLAVLRGLESLPADWVGTVCSDSQVTLGRLFAGWKWTNIPLWMHQLYQEQAKRLVYWSAIRHQLLAGHPTRAQLQAGAGHSGLPVSEHNKWCDAMCGLAAEAHLKAGAR